MTCNQVQEKLVDLIDGSLGNAEEKTILAHLKKCKTCKKVESEMRTLLLDIDRYNLEQPDLQMDVAFSHFLREEKEKNTENIGIQRTKNSTRLLQLAATVSLILGSFLFGLNRNTAKYEKQLVQMKQQVALTLMESNSASKRIQAVTYSEELDETNTEILDALIHMMNNDHQINVRLAAATALSKHVTNEKVREALILLLEEESNPNMQLELIQILSTILDERIKPSLKRIQEDKNTSPTIKKAILEHTENRQS